MGKTLKQILDPLLELTRDVAACEKQLVAGEQHSRRSYIRSLFAMIEGTIYCVKELEFAELYSREKKDIRTLVALKETVFEITSKGDVSEKVKFVQTSSNLRFMAKCFQYIFGKQLELNVGSSKWDSFIKAIKVRNRITHPKTSTDLQISDDDLHLVTDVNEWFNEIIKEIIEHVSVYYK